MGIMIQSKDSPQKDMVEKNTGRSSPSGFLTGLAEISFVWLGSITSWTLHFPQSP